MVRCQKGGAEKCKLPLVGSQRAWCISRGCPEYSLTGAMLRRVGTYMFIFYILLHYIFFATAMNPLQKKWPGKCKLHFVRRPHKKKQTRLRGKEKQNFCCNNPLCMIWVWTCWFPTSLGPAGFNRLCAWRRSPCELHPHEAKKKNCRQIPFSQTVYIMSIHRGLRTAMLAGAFGGCLQPAWLLHFFCPKI